MTIACSVCGEPMDFHLHTELWVCPAGCGVITAEEIHRMTRPRLDPPCTPMRSTMTDTPASSADSATSSPPSPETASAGTHQLPDVAIDFTFKRQPEKVVISGTKPYVLLTLTDKGVSITGGGLPEEAPTGAVIEFLIAAGDTFHDIAKTMSEQLEDA